MAYPSVTYSFSNSTTADATQVNQNFTDIINGLSDGTKDLSVSAITAAGNVTLNANVTLGNASSDTLTVTASLASSIPINTTYSYDLGSATIGMRAIFLGSSDSAARTTKLAGATVASSWTLTLPTAVPTANNQVLTSDTNGTTSWQPRGAWVAISSQTASSSATIAFTGLDSTYSRYMIALDNVKPATDDVIFEMQVGTGATPTYQTSGYAYACWLQGSGGGTSSVASTSANYIPLTATAGGGTGLGNGTGENLTGIVNFSKPSESDYCILSFQTAYINASSGYIHFSGMGSYGSATAITAVRFLCSSGNIASGTFTLYGLRTS